MIDGVITIPNWEKHQSADQLEKIKEQTRERVAKHREKQKALSCNVTSNATDRYNETLRNATDKNREEKDKNREEKKGVKNDGRRKAEGSFDYDHLTE